MNHAPLAEIELATAVATRTRPSATAPLGSPDARSASPLAGSPGRKPPEVAQPRHHRDGPGIRRRPDRRRTSHPRDMGEPARASARSPVAALEARRTISTFSCDIARAVSRRLRSRRERLAPTGPRLATCRRRSRTDADRRCPRRAIVAAVDGGPQPRFRGCRCRCRRLHVRTWASGKARRSASMPNSPFLGHVVVEVAPSELNSDHRDVLHSARLSSARLSSSDERRALAVRKPVLADADATALARPCLTP